MYKIEYLSPLEIQELDPTGKGRAALSRLTGDSYLPLPDYLLESPETIKDAYLRNLSRMSCERHKPYLEYNEEMLAKWHRQGGSFSLEKVLKYYESSYSNASYEVRCGQVLSDGTAYLIRSLRKALEYAGAVSASAPVRGTFAGLPSCSVKGAFDAESIGFSGSLRHLYPVIPGVRRMRGKDRVINQDATPNVRMVEGLTSRLRNTLRTLLPQWFGSWLSPEVVIRPTVTRALAKRYTNLETDYTHMDEYYSQELALNNFLPVWKTVLAPSEMIIAEAYLSEVFYQPVFCGHYLLTGKHNWFSGITLTQDAETVYSVSLHLGAILHAGYNPAHAQILSIGDDVLVLTPSSWDIARIANFVRAEAELNHMVLSLEKCRMGTDGYRYCRNVYYNSGKRDPEGILYGSYPTVLALNSIVQPETRCNSRGQECIATLQRLDNCVGSFDYAALVDLVWKYTSILHDLKFTDDDIARYSAKDWWFRVYGESWSPTVSPTYKFLQSKYL